VVCVGDVWRFGEGCGDVGGGCVWGCRGVGGGDGGGGGHGVLGVCEVGTHNF
jgi:hypothetical protein